jgi:hypothetical protein
VLGIPRHSFKDIIKMYPEEIGLDGVEWSRVVRVFVNTVP